MDINFLGINYGIHQNILSMNDVNMLDILEMKYNHEIMRKLRKNFHQIVLLGNKVLATYLAEKMFKEDGYGFNKYHSLALTAQSVEEL